jgi:hypothetical protein
VLSDTSIRTIVLSHGQIARHAEQTEVVALRQRDELASMKELVVPHDQPRRQAGWPKELNAAVEVALAAEQVYPADGVSWADWERGKRRSANGNQAGSRGTLPPGASTGSGAGKQFFREDENSKLRLIAAKSFSKGIVKLTYDCSTDGYSAPRISIMTATAPRTPVLW